jgi:hypothetical protein
MLNSRCARLIWLGLVLLLLSACSTAPYRYQPLENFEVTQRAVTQTLGDIEVSASVPSKEEAEQILGIPIYNRGIQPVWLKITNNSPTRARFIHVSVDREYFSPLEVAYMHKKYFSKQGWMDMEKYLMEISIPRHIPAGESRSGFIYTHAKEGTKSFNVDVFYTGKDEPEYEEFTFFINVPGFVPDHASVDWANLYDETEIRNLGNDELRSELLQLQCCTTNRSGSGQGQPANIILVADGREVLQSLLRAGWSETSYERDDNYLNNVNYLFGRPPDAVFRKSRGRSTLTVDRNELSVWLAPFKNDGVGVWVAQIKHAIGQRYKINEIFFGAAQDPDVDDGRNFLFQNLWYSQSLMAVAFIETDLVVPVDKPVLDFNNNAFFTDGGRLVLWLSGDPVALQDVRSLRWDVPEHLKTGDEP